MTTRAPFALSTTPLDAGTTLIEASAGTGKTFTISRLFLRLIIERDFAVTEILVVTYTEAATEELRDRVRRTLLDAADYFRTGQSPQPDLAALLAPFRPNAPTLLRRLERALTSFDEAPIFTIHGFCQRMLRDRAFESGDLFDLELVTDETELMEEVTADYWRRTFYETDPVVVSFVLKNKLEPGLLLRWLRSVRRQHELRILSPVQGRSVGELTEDLVNRFSAARRSWQRGHQSVREILAQARAWAKGDHAKPEMVEQHTTATQNAFVVERFGPEALEGLEFLSRSSLAMNTRYRKTTPEHPFFAACEELAQAAKDLLTGLRIDFLTQAGAEMVRRKRLHKLQSFDDLLLRLREALRAPGGPDLVREIRQRYRAALIDEFQDTDPVQAEIFQRIFDAPSRPRESDGRAPVLFLIGDPKQAIYAFRGADIFTYRDAAARIANAYTLEQNWRSEATLVRAVNTIFSRVAQPFVFDFIRFQPVVASVDADAEPLRESGQRLPPFHLWFVPRPSGTRPMNKRSMVLALGKAVGTEIVRLLNGQVTLGERAITPRDIAVLVPENRQANLMQDILRGFGIPSVLHTEESVFTSREAAELLRVLSALATPGQERLLRAAWVTDLLGFTAPQLEAKAADAAAWQAIVERAYALREQWLRQGFSPMFRSWLQTAGVRARLLGFVDGERRLTNLLHLAEVLHQAAHERQLGPAGLVRWLGEQIAAREFTEQHQLRLERDDQAVRLITIHKSKGLQYPIVFCPFSWNPSGLRKGDVDVFCHRESAESGASEFIWDLGSEDLDEHRNLAIKEKLAENLRLLYVALTRAQHRCYFAWGAMPGGGSSAATWLFHPPPRLTEPFNESLDQHFKSLSDAAIRRDLAALVEASKNPTGTPAIHLTDVPRETAARYLPPGETTATLQPRNFTRTIPRDWRITSFSALVAHADAERPDYDPAPAETEAAALDVTEAVPGPPAAAAAVPAMANSPAQGIFAFPRGTGPGTCLHKIFESLDFTDLEGAAAGQDSLERITRRELTAAGLSLDWSDVVQTTVRRTLQVPLSDPAGKTTLKLTSLGRESRLNEMEFQFPTHHITPDRLRGALGHVPAAPDFQRCLARLGFRPARGFLKGYIDLVFAAEGRFHLVDWKSNWLGDRAEYYSPSTVRTVMSDNFYVLQYHLYTVALHLYLSRRLPGYDYDQHFGGIHYLFLRGLDPDRPERGVFRDRPPRQTVEGLVKILLDP